MAQWLAQQSYTLLVGGSNPSSPTIFQGSTIALAWWCEDESPGSEGTHVGLESGDGFR